jgi:hypothetical protein
MIQTTTIVLLMILALPATTRAECFIATPKQTAVWQRMKAEQHPWYRLIIERANRPTPDYAEEGRFELLAYLMTNETRYAQKSYEETRINTQDFTRVYTGNEAREMTIEHAMIHGCLRPAWTAQQVATHRAWLIKIAEAAIAQNRLGDSDQNVGNYFGLALTDKVLGTTYSYRAFRDITTGELTPVGGLTATACDMSTLRNAICHYVQNMAAGGHWIEAAGGYNEGTTQLLYMGAHWAGIEHFPEVKAFLPQQAQYLFHFLTPGLKDSFQIGDVEHPHEIRLWYDFGDLLSMLAGLTDEAALAAALRGFEADIYAAHNYTVNPILARYFYFSDPYAPKMDWRDLAGNFHVASGQGHSFWRTGHAATDSALHFNAPAFKNGAVDHFQAFVAGDLRWFSKGRFLLDRPLGYQADPRFGNTVLIKGMGPSFETGGLIAAAFQPAAIAYAAGVNAGIGPSVYYGYGLPVPTYLHENSRAVFQPLDGDANVVMIVDRVHAEDPLTLKADAWPWPPGYLNPEELYYPTELEKFKRARGLKDWIWHMPVAPTVTQKAIQWRAGETTVTIDHVYPSSPPIYAIVDERTDSTLGGYMHPTEKKFAVHELPAGQAWGAQLPTAPRAFDVTVHCLREGVTARCVPVTNTSGEPVVGATIFRSGRTPVTLLTSAKPGPKLTTTMQLTPSGGNVVAFNAAKILMVTAGRQLCQGFTVSSVRGTVYLADLCDATWIVRQGGRVLPLLRIGDLWRVEVPSGGTLSVSASGR